MQLFFAPANAKLFPAQFVSCQFQLVVQNLVVSQEGKGALVLETVRCRPWSGNS